MADNVLRSLCYVVTDIETDGPEPGNNSMRSFASVAVDQGGTIFDHFEVRLNQLDGATPNPAILAWLQSHPEAWADATRDPQAPLAAMQRYVAWLRGLGKPAIFTAHPLAFDGFWIDWYLRKFTNLRLAWGFGPGDPPFAGSGLDLGSLIMGTMGWDYTDCIRAKYPEAWFGGHAHTHRAIDDAMGYAHVLIEMLQRRKSQA